MSNKFPKEAKGIFDSAKNRSKSNRSKIAKKHAKISLLEAIVGATNVKRWNTIKDLFCCETNENFATKLLNLAEEALNSKTPQEEYPDQENAKTRKKSKCQRKVPKPKDIKEKPVMDDGSSQISCQNPKTPSESGRESVEECVENSSLEKKDSVPKACIQEKDTTLTSAINQSEVSFSKTVDHNVTTRVESINEGITKSNEAIHILQSAELSTHNEIQEFQPEVDSVSTVGDSLSIEKSIAILKCQNCNTQHAQDMCPTTSIDINYPKCQISDSIIIEEWQEHYEDEYTRLNNIESGNENDIRNENSEAVSFARLSLPNVLQFLDSTPEHGLGVWAKTYISASTQFGPLIGKIVKEVDISEDSTMRDLWEIPLENGNVYMNTEDLTMANWLRYIRPAPAADKRNMSVVIKEKKIFVVTTTSIKEGDELLYWQDPSVPNNKKKLEKTVCGGCNMTFAHPLYYRIHCSVFHDVRYSLTIRKYHCKVCGAAILGKENIMKHAAELHNGQGAYQCQFCKKFFLRLNYLEMHRTYGCSANPHRSRPLCDFCGRKFCQPQKLKVHIKRMHSDFSEVLKEFQCKNCLKILGSRAALQRHSKEVHQKFSDGNCSCPRCGKHFQNKSNLKIHMLTHSGIKPFRCNVKSCNAAFTTKQCLQFHYKKVHNYDEEKMPKIERSVEYTLEAYSGVEEYENKRNEDSNSHRPESNGNVLNEEDDEEEEGEEEEEEEEEEESDVDEPDATNEILDNLKANQSPLREIEEAHPHSPEEHTPSAVLETYRATNPINSISKILSKGSKKWIADQEVDSIRSEIYQLEHKIYKDDLTNVPLQLPEPQSYSRSKLIGSNLSDLTRHHHDAANASLLVEAALDSVCSEPNNVDIVDVSSTPNCTAADALNNLYTLAPTDTLTDVTYSEAVDMKESRDVNLISPSVNDHISVTDDLHDELGPNQTIGLDYSGFHQEEFDLSHKTNFVKNYINSLSPQNHNNYSSNQDKPRSPVGCSPPRYDFSQPLNTDHLSSDDSDGMTAQNLSIHSKHDIQLDLSAYNKPTYKFDAQFHHPKRTKFDDDIEKNVSYHDEQESNRVCYNEDESNTVDSEHLKTAMTNNELSSKITDIDLKETEDNLHRKYTSELSNEIKAKLELDLDVRIKSYDMNADHLRSSRILYDTAADIDFRNKCYDLIDTVETRNKSLYDSIEQDFRPPAERSFEPLVLNSSASSELQGLDMSARTFQSYSTMNRYHHLYPPEVDRVDLRLSYSPPAPSYTHSDILRVVSLDLTPPGRHSVELSLRNHPLHPITNSRLLTDHGLQPNPSHRLLTDQSRLLGSDLSTRHLPGLSDAGARILSDHTANRILSSTDQLSTILPPDQRLLGEDSRILSDQSRLLDGRILPPPQVTPSGPVSPVPAFSGYSVNPSPYHPTLGTRQHVPSSTPTAPFHHYSTYY